MSLYRLVFFDNSWACSNVIPCSLAINSRVAKSRSSYILAPNPSVNTWYVWLALVKSCIQGMSSLGAFLNPTVSIACIDFEIISGVYFASISPICLTKLLPKLWVAKFSFKASLDKLTRTSCSLTLFNLPFAIDFKFFDTPNNSPRDITSR